MIKTRSADDNFSDLRRIFLHFYKKKRTKISAKVIFFSNDQFFCKEKFFDSKILKDFSVFDFHSGIIQSWKLIAIWSIFSKIFVIII